MTARWKMLVAALALAAGTAAVCPAKQRLSPDEAWAQGKNAAVGGSDLIGRAGYDAEAKELRIQMVHSSDWYIYKDVPPEVADEFWKSDSKGAFFGANIKGRYEYERKE